MCVKPIVRIVLCPCLDWNTCAGALVNHVSSLCFHCKRSSLNPCPSPPSQPPVQDTCRQITLLPAFIAPCLSFSFTSSLGTHTHGITVHLVPLFNSTCLLSPHFILCPSNSSYPGQQSYLAAAISAI